MIYLAFRRVKNHPNKEDFQGLPEEYIVEVTTYNKDVHTTKDGWESLLEPQAQTEINKNKGFLDEKRSKDKAYAESVKASEKAVDELQQARLNKEYREYQEFLQFKQRMKVQADESQKELIEKLDRLRQDLAPVETFNPFKKEV